MSQPLFNQSVNIVRNADRTLTYYPTDNTRRIVSQLLTDYHAGLRAFTLISSYGTGKSAFLTSAKTRRRRMSGLYEILSKSPFRLKQELRLKRKSYATS
ncbi:hypothetical protein [Spirosoma spitsbergense]|uniref:hypothetical protein n=1 Tax=Spirosoma spitsbergense TaxID=431554 RepID=UPI00035CF8AE|nr:hypothetical protein [Spirosoma spitsbergense]